MEKEEDIRNSKDSSFRDTRMDLRELQRSHSESCSYWACVSGSANFLTIKWKLSIEWNIHHLLFLTETGLWTRFITIKIDKPYYFNFLITNIKKGMYPSFAHPNLTCLLLFLGVHARHAEWVTFRQQCLAQADWPQNMWLKGNQIINWPVTYIVNIIQKYELSLPTFSSKNWYEDKLISSGKSSWKTTK